MLKAIIIDGWACCPLHKTKLCRVGEHVRARDIKLWCNNAGQRLNLIHSGLVPQITFIKLCGGGIGSRLGADKKFACWER